MKHWIYRVLMLVLLGAVLSGCQQRQETGEAAYKIYYLNPAMTKLMPQNYATDTTDQEQLIQELFHQFITVPKELDMQVALSSKVKLQKYQKEESVLYLYFDAGYSSRSNMNKTREILCRAALAKTMTQIPGIDYINIYVGEQPLMDDGGNPVGMLAGSDFIESITDVNAYEKTVLTLYFADETGQQLVAEKREVVHNINTSLEKLVVEELLAGPQAEGAYPTLLKETKLLNVSVNGSVCYINLDNTFLSNTLPLNEQIPIYSIVNSLSELTTVTQVQITVNGSQDVMFRDIISLNQLFEQNLNLGGTKN